MKTILHSYLLLFSFILLPGLSKKSHAQEPDGYDIEANIIYRFTKYVDWPDANKTGDFIIGVVGDSPLTNALASFIVHKTVGNRRIVIKKINASSEILNCHILFISEEESVCLKKLALRIAGNPVLIVTEADGLAGKGSCINFAISGNHLKLEINKNNIEHRGLSVASELLQLGKIVK